MIPHPTFYSDGGPSRVCLNHTEVNVIKCDKLQKCSCLYISFKTKLEMQRALEEDASVYEYDSIYDDMQKKKEEDTAKLLSGQDRKVCIHCPAYFYKVFRRYILCSFQSRVKIHHSK